MKRIQLGINLESLGLPLRRALAEAGRLGVTGVQINAVGDLDPRALSQTGRREFKHLLRSHALELTALGCPLRHGLDIAENQQQRIEHVQKVMDLSFDLGPRQVIVQAGRIPEKPDEPGAALLTEALLVLGRHGDRSGAVLALETGLEPGSALRAYLDQFDSGGLGVHYDPANLLMGGFDPYESAKALQGRIVHASAKDAQERRANRLAQEVPVGAGDIEWFQMAATLEEIDYRGWLVVKRETGDHRAADVAAGVNFLRRIFG